MKFATSMTVNRLSEVVWEIPTTEKSGMLVPARIYGTETILGEMDAGVFEQVTNVACLPGVQRYAVCMPDGHLGVWVSHRGSRGLRHAERNHFSWRGRI